MGVYKDKAARIPIGVVSKFYPNGTVKHEVNYKDGKLTGVVKSYYNNGQTMRLEQYDNYQLISGKYFTPEGKDTTLTPYFRYPSYKEGDVELQKFLQHYKIYPLDALRRGLEGTAMVGLLVQKDGYIGKIGIVSSSNEFFNKEALRVIELTRHNWIPGIDEGEPADIAISVPVVFSIN
jgi:TonB family protein